MNHDMQLCLSAALLPAWLLVCPVGHMIAGSQQTLRVQSGGLSPDAGLLFGGCSAWCWGPLGLSRT